MSRKPTKLVMTISKSLDIDKDLKFVLGGVEYQLHKSTPMYRLAKRDVMKLKRRLAVAKKLNQKIK